MADEIEKAVSDWNKHYKKTKAWLKKNEERRIFKTFDDYECSTFIDEGVVRDRDQITENKDGVWQIVNNNTREWIILTKRERELLIKRCQRNLAILSEGIN